MHRIVRAFLLGCAIVGQVQAADPSPEAPIHPERVLEQLAQVDLDPVVAAFDATMTDALPKPKLQAVWSSVVAQTGAYKSHGTAQISKEQGYRVALIPTVFENIELQTKLVFDSAGKIAGLFFLPPAPKADPEPPAYAKAGAFKEISLVAGSPGWPLPATLAMPEGAGPFPAVVLVHGSGPHDRDETVGGVKPFRDLAAGLAARKIAVLRYEKRTREFGAKLALDKTLTIREEVVDDAVAAVALLRKTPGIDPARVFVAGHSLGAMLLPEIGKRDTRLAGLIALAGPARPLEDLLVEQTRYVLEASGASAEVKQAKIAEMELVVQQIKDPRYGKEEGSGPLVGAWPKYWASIRGYHAAEAARAIPRPFLILQGERDYQVSMRDFALWKEALAGRADVRFHSYPKLNHLFVEGVGPSTPAEYERRGNVSEGVITDVAAWIAGIPKPPSPAPKTN